MAKKLTTLVHGEQAKKAETVARALFLGGMSVERVLIKRRSVYIKGGAIKEERLQREAAVRKGKKEFRRWQVVLD